MKPKSSFVHNALQYCPKNIHHQQILATSMSLFSLGLLAAYFAAGMQFMMVNEGWDAADAFYFWCVASTPSTRDA